MIQKIVIIIFKSTRRVLYTLNEILENIICLFLFYVNNITHKSFKVRGRPFISVAFGASCQLGDSFMMNNSISSNPIGRNQPCILFVDKNASLKIGNNVGLSSTAIIAHHSITIGDNVKIGGGVCIYDTDFHSLNLESRLNPALDKLNAVCKPVNIGNGVFIGAHSTILKGVSIGENSIIGACSLVVKSIPPNEIWGGNPAKFIGNI